MDEREKYQEAKKRVEEMKGFYFHLIHAFTVFGNVMGKSWEERKVKEIMEKDKRV